MGGFAIELTEFRSIFLLLMAAGAIGFASTDGTRNGTSMNSPRRSNRARQSLSETLSQYSPVGLQVAIFGALILVAGIAAATLPMWRGTTETAFTSRGYSVDSALSYGGDVAVSGLYDENLLEPPAPIFRSITAHLPISHRSSISGPGSTPEIDAIVGTRNITATVTLNNGWSRTFALAGDTPFTEQSAVLNTSLSFARVDALIDEFEQASGTHASTYGIRIDAKTTVTARINGETINETATSLLSFSYTVGQQLTLHSRGLASRETSAGGSVSEQIEVTRYASIPIFGDTAIRNLVPTGIIGIVVGSVMLIIVAVATIRTRAAAPAGPIRARLGQLVARTEELPPLPARIFEVESVDDLAAVAESRGHVILEDLDGPVPQYLVFEGDATYRYTAAG